MGRNRAGIPNASGHERRCNGMQRPHGTRMTFGAESRGSARVPPSCGTDPARADRNSPRSQPQGFSPSGEGAWRGLSQKVSRL